MGSPISDGFSKSERKDILEQDPVQMKNGNLYFKGNHSDVLAERITLWVHENPEKPIAATVPDIESGKLKGMFLIPMPRS